MIVALAGRRVDPPGVTRDRFPTRNVGLVRERLRALFQTCGGRTLVCSAACGADLLALETAGMLGWRRRVILPFERASFRTSSVTDRPGDWGQLYDRILDDLEPAGDVQIQQPAPHGMTGYGFASQGILDEAGRLSETLHESQAAVLVWDGVDSGPEDMTLDFAVAAQRRGLTVLQVSTLD